MDIVCKPGIITLKYNTHTVIVPSPQYPLVGIGAFLRFNQINTAPISDPRITEVFNSVSASFGGCYTNVVKLYDALKERDLHTDAKICVGWLVYPNAEYPIHHAWMVINNNQLLDFCVNDIRSTEEGRTVYNSFLRGRADNLEAEKNAYAQTLIHFKNNYPNAEIYSCGVEKWGLTYIGRECDVRLGEISRRDLQNRYPNHPNVVVMHTLRDSAPLNHTSVFRTIFKNVF